MGSSSDMELESSPPPRPGSKAGQSADAHERTRVASSPLKSASLPSIVVQRPSSSPDLGRSIFRNFDSGRDVREPYKPKIKGLPGRQPKMEPKSESPPASYAGQPGVQVKIESKPAIVDSARLVNEAVREYEALAEKSHNTDSNSSESLDKPSPKSVRLYDEVMRIGGSWKNKEAAVQAVSEAAAQAEPAFEVGARGGKSHELRFTIGCKGVGARGACNFSLKVEKHQTNGKDRWRIYELNDIHSDNCRFVSPSKEAEKTPTYDRQAMRDKRSALNALPAAARDYEEPPRARRKRAITETTNEDDDEDAPSFEREYTTRSSNSPKRKRGSSASQNADHLFGLIALLRLHAGDALDTGDLEPLAQHMLAQGLVPTLLTPDHITKVELHDIMTTNVIRLLSRSAENAVTAMSTSLNLWSKPHSPDKEDAQDWLGAAEEAHSLSCWLAGLHPFLATNRIVECLSMLGITHDTLNDQISKKLADRVQSQLESMASEETTVAERVILSARIKAWCKAMRKADK